MRSQLNRRILPRQPRAWRNGLLIGLALAALAACGPVPHPFERQPGDHNVLLDDHRAMAPVVVQTDALPGLDQEMVKALDAQEIAATTDTKTFHGDSYHLTGARQDGKLVWTLTAPDGKTVVGSDSQPIADGIPPEQARADLAANAAVVVAHLMRGEDSGVSDIEARPRVLVHPVKTPHNIDGAALTRDMANALAAQDLNITGDKPAFIVDGDLQVMNGTGTQAVIQVVWTVRDADGKSLATVSQGGPANPLLAMGDLGPLAHQIAAAGAPGIAQVIHHPAPAK